jgi:hypothetical protein
MFRHSDEERDAFHAHLNAARMLDVSRLGVCLPCLPKLGTFIAGS